jgi:hypothetical protein
MWFLLVVNLDDHRELRRPGKPAGNAAKPGDVCV